MRVKASRWARAATSYAARSAAGVPLDRSLRVTLNFHPDRLCGELTLVPAALEALRTALAVS